MFRLAQPSTVLFSHVQPYTGCTAMDNLVLPFTAFNSHAYPFLAMYNLVQHCSAMHSLVQVCTAMYSTTMLRLVQECSAL